MRVIDEAIPLRAKASRDCSLDTQAIYGEVVVVYEIEEGWAWGQLSRDGYVGYLPTMRAAARDGVVYGANAWPTIVAVGAPERMLDRGIIRVLEFLGKLKPEEERFHEVR